VSRQHENFRADVAVGRLTPEEGADVRRFVADITVQCVDCDAKFGWRGVPPGVNSDGPTRSVDALELRAPLLTPTELELKGRLPGLTPDPPTGDPAFTIRVMGS
jgi:hypothetical protein